MSQKYEFYTTGESSAVNIYPSVQRAQTFTPGTAHKITSVKLKLYRNLNPPTFYVDIKATDGNGHPTGAALCSGSMNGGDLTTDSNGAWYEISLGDGANLSQGTKYAIVVRNPNGSTDNRVHWRRDGAGATYSGGCEENSSDSGSSWSSNTGSDLMFEEWGEPPVMVPTVTTNPADNINHQSAKLHGTLTNDGGEACQVRFQYGETDAYGTDTDWQDGKTSSDTFEQLISNLDDEKTYHFRAQAKNSAGTGDGADAEFTTTAAPPPPPTSRKVIISHPALKCVRILKDGAEIGKYDFLSDLEQSYIQSSIEIPVTPPATIEVTTLAGQTYNYVIPTSG